MEAKNANKKPGWTRAVDIVARTGHVAAIGVVFAAAVFGIPSRQILPWNIAATVTGAVLVVSEIYHRPYWIQQCRGIMVLIHIGFLGLIHLFPNSRIFLLVMAIIFGMVGSHMPKNIRYRFIFRNQDVS